MNLSNLILILVSFISLGCSDSISKKKPEIEKDMAPDVVVEDLDTGPLTLEKYCTRLGKRFGADLEYCNSSGVVSGYRNTEERTRLLAKFCFHSREFVDEGAVVFDINKAEKCLSKLDAHKDRCNRYTKIKKLCPDVLVGTKKDTDSCEETIECSSGYYCSNLKESCRTCVPYKQRGEACPPHSECDPSLECKSGKCVPVPTLGEDCIRDCLEGVCKDGGEGKKCLAQVDHGEPCDATKPCRANLCVDGICITKSEKDGPCIGEKYSDHCIFGQLCLDSRCVDVPKVGEACSQYYCVDSICVEGICTAQGREGEACVNDRPLEKRCGKNLACINARCEKVGRKENDFCEFNQCDLGLTCHKNRCTKPLAIGEECLDYPSTEWRNEETWYSSPCVDGARCNGSECILDSDSSPHCTKNADCPGRHNECGYQFGRTRCHLDACF